jgi:hypothetical protein
VLVWAPSSASGTANATAANSVRYVMRIIRLCEGRENISLRRKLAQLATPTYITADLTLQARPCP